MSESKLGAVLPIDKMPKNCRECQFCRHYNFTTITKQMNHLDCGVLEVFKNIPLEVMTSDDRHPQCPLQPITPNSNVESALEVISEEYCIRESFRETPEFKELHIVKAELSKISALEKEKVDSKIEAMRLEGLLELSNSIGKANANKLNAIEEVMNEYGSRGGRIGGYNLFGKITKILNRSDSNDK